MRDRVSVIRFLLLALGCVGLVARAAAEFPSFVSDEETDAWLKKTSAFYREMADAVTKRGGYSFRTFAGGHGGMMRVERGAHVIELSDTLHGPERVSVLIFEMTNAFQQPKHDMIDRRVIDGEITDPIHFGLLQELIEYDGLGLHERVLRELHAPMGDIPPAMFVWVTPVLGGFANYHLPRVLDYVDAQAKSGHTAHYHQWFWVQKATGDAKKNR